MTDLLTGAQLQVSDVGRRISVETPRYSVSGLLSGMYAGLEKGGPQRYLILTVHEKDMAGNGIDATVRVFEHDRVIRILPR